MVDSSSNTVIFVKGMTCQTCVNTVTKRVSRMPGVTAVNVELASGVVDIHHGAGFPGAGEAKAQIIDLGYEVGES